MAFARMLMSSYSPPTGRLPDAAPTGAIRVELQFILLRQGGLHHDQGVPEGRQRAGRVGPLIEPCSF
jgi:hypothetical protein